jgi:hypothetical protein
MLPVRVVLDPGVGRLRRYPTRVVVPNPAGDLLRRPVVREARTHGLVDCRIVHLPPQRPFPPSPLGLPLCGSGAIFAVGTVAGDLPANRRGMPPQPLRDFLPRGPLIQALHYAIAIIRSKMHWNIPAMFSPIPVLQG